MHGGEAAVGFNEQVNVRSYGLADSAYRLHGVLFGLSRDMGAPGTRERVELQGSKTARHHLLGFRRVRLGGFGTVVPSIGIHADFIATGPAQKVVDRCTKALPSKIVLRHVGKMLDVQVRTFDEIAPELAHMRDDALITVSLCITFSPAADALTGVDFDKEPVFPRARIDQEGGDCGNVHRKSPSAVGNKF